MKILSAEFIISAAEPNQFPVDKKPQIAFAGRSNVGKSSIINSLLHRKDLVKTSSTPGKTQLINFFRINDSFYFADLPGYGYARIPRAVAEKLAPMIEGYLRGAQGLAAVVMLLDSRRELDDRDTLLSQWLKQYNLPVIYALTKIDKLNRQEVDRAQKTISSALGVLTIPTSAKSGQGIKELWDVIQRHLDAE